MEPARPSLPLAGHRPSTPGLFGAGQTGMAGRGRRREDGEGRRPGSLIKCTKAGRRQSIIQMIRQALVWVALWTGATSIEILRLREVGRTETANVTGGELTVRVEVDRGLVAQAGRGYLLLYPDAADPYEVSAGQKDDLKLRCVGMRASVCVLNLHDEAGALESIKGYEVEMVTKCQGRCSGSLGVAVADFVSVGLLGSVNIVLDDVEQLRVEVRANTTAQSNKIRFHAGGYAKTASLEAASLQAFANKDSAGWPDAAAHDFELFHIHGHELSRVVYAGDMAFCRPAANCAYRFVLATRDMWRVVFYAFDAGKVEALTAFESYVGAAH